MAHDAEAACDTLAELHRRLGVGAHLDDFGTGASSLRFLHRFPGDALKVDRSLVIGMLTDTGSHAIVKAVVGLAHNLGMEVVGEGVESAAHLDALAELGCESVQGFHLSPPLTAEAATHMLTERDAAEAGSAAPLLP
jgi:EAL domain-containing protein (putative c-di-GMP-specific phosphodiesterase class I)